MEKPIIQVEQLSKAYRIGLEENRPDTMAGIMLQALKAPIKNFKNIRNLRVFNKEEESVFWALRDVNFDVRKGEVLGIIGHNGAGKSTLLKILSRITEPTHGRVTIYGRVCSLLEVGTGFHPDLSGRENIYLNGTILGMTKREIDHKLEEIVEFSGVSRHIDTPVKRYSSGMIVRLAFSVAAHLEPEILIIDEVLAVGDAEFQKKCLGKMKSVGDHGRTVIFVSHNLGAVRSLCTRGIFLKSGQINYSGSIQDTIQNYIAKKDSKIENIGIVSETMRTINTGEVRIVRLVIFDNDKNVTQDIYYQSDMEILISLEVYQSLKDVLVDIRIISEDGVTVDHVLNSILGGSLISLDKGNKEILVTIKNRLAPGSYSITAGIHLSNGLTIEYIEDVYPFTVLKSSNDFDSYPYEWVYGYVHQRGHWQILN
jgi:lipopolysaccharide transport system ATP-binding protein